MNSVAGMSDRLVRSAELAALSRLEGRDYRLLAPSPDEDEVALAGEFRLQQLRPGLVLHSTDAFEVATLHAEAVLEPAISCLILLEGAFDARIGGRDFAMGRAAGRDAAPLGRLTCLARQEQFERRSTGGGRVRKVNVTISPEWLEDGGLGADCGPALLDFTQSHLSVARWRPSARIVALAEQILRPPPYAAVLRSLYLESRALEIVQEALQAVAHAGMTPAAALRPGEDRRIRAVRDFLEENLTAVLSLEEIAREVGLGVSTLQRQFRAVYGTSVFDYLRHRRLELARDALERDGVSVAQAAYIAGYSSPANFATAFRRSFGVPPKHLRARL